jgi:hypothetical protein
MHSYIFGLGSSFEPVRYCGANSSENADWYSDENSVDVVRVVTNAQKLQQRTKWRNAW